ncbi:MAG: outer membrane beta-barrel protein [Legionellaceae bacterium]|nr:outer membrane beta-barrel protein [Legionellaceae bacterium]
MSKMMSRLSSVALLLSSCTLFAYEPIDGWYGGVMGTVSKSTTLTFNLPNPDLGTDSIASSLSYKVGGGASVNLGYRYEHFRLEGEILYISDNFDSLQIGNTYSISSFSKSGLPYFKGATNLVSFLGNFLYEITFDDMDWAPYIGVGIGYAHLQNTVNFYTATGTLIAGSAGRADADAGILQGIVGFELFLDDAFTLNADYRYLTTNEISSLQNARAQFNTLNFGLTFTFD